MKLYARICIFLCYKRSTSTSLYKYLIYLHNKVVFVIDDFIWAGISINGPLVLTYKYYWFGTALEKYSKISLKTSVYRLILDLKLEALVCHNMQSQIQ